MAERHLKRKDYTAAAVYARKALESLCHRTCAKASLFVLHIEFPKQRKVEHFLIALTSRLKEIVDDERRTRALRLLTRLDHARTFVLNRNAHFDVEEEDILSAEVDTAIDVVSDLRTFFNEQAWDRKNFHSGRKLTPLEQMNAQLATARALVTKGAIGSCQAAMKLAHHFFWQVFGSKLDVLLPPGVEPKASAVWKASEEQGKLQTASQTRLEAVKGYLFGSVKGNEFDAEKFEQAANLLEYLVNDHRELSLIS
jgi:HEPN domain-containing protein